jgi:hypothetical protein
MTQYIAHLINSIGQLTSVNLEVCFETVFLTTRNILRGMTRSQCEVILKSLGVQILWTVW